LLVREKEVGGAQQAAEEIAGPVRELVTVGIKYDERTGRYNSRKEFIPSLRELESEGGSKEWGNEIKQAPVPGGGGEIL